jgi:hypothetical protein
MHDVTGTTHVPGDETVQSAYRSELAGLLGTIRMADELYSFHSMTQANIKVACDGESALHMAVQLDRRIKLSTPNYNLLMAICYAFDQKLSGKLNMYEAIKMRKKSMKNFYEPNN